MDTISDILNRLKLTGCLYFTTNFSSPWGIRVPDYKHVARFHLVTAGQCWLRLTVTDDAHLLNAGDIVIIPHGASHILSDHPDTAVVELEQAISSSNYQGERVFSYGGNSTQQAAQIICGHLEFDDRYQHALINQLPSLLIIRSNEALQTPWFSDSLRFMMYEVQAERMGNMAIIQRLSEVIFIHAIRLWSERTQQDSGFLQAASDPKLQKSLQAFHNDPARHWTLNDLAIEAGMSRTLFAQRFRVKANMSVMQYVTQWRAQQAQHMLLESSLSVAQIAEAVGYDSIAAFSRMFKREFGIGPGTYRKQRHNPDDSQSS